MPSVPIPVISALVLGFLFAALVLRRDRHWLLSVLVGACDRLLAGESVAVAMDSSGFGTRSNFNREFRRITGKSPSDWRDAATRG